MDSNVGLAIQCLGVTLVMLLSFFMMRTIKSTAMRYWTAAWSSLSLALASLFVGFHVQSWRTLFYTIYFLGEYTFGCMFVAGCIAYTGRSPITRQQQFLVASLLIAVGLCLPHLSSDFNDLFIVQAALMTCLFVSAYIALRPARLAEPQNLGLRVMSLALLALAVDFFHYILVFGARNGVWGILIPSVYLKYTSIIDLILEILLGYGTVMVLMESVRQGVEDTNRELTRARDKLERIARLDPLTEALNRHAFYSFIKQSQSSAEGRAVGCVAVLDMDNLKPINDTLGHTAGDQAIRAVASAARALIRADDLLFRWGGDEFLLLMFGIGEAEARRRLETLNETLAQTSLREVSVPVTIRVSYGLMPITSLAEIERDVERADRAMYEAKQGRKSPARLTEEEKG